MEKGSLKYQEHNRLFLFGIPLPFTKFLIYENDLVILHGILKQTENDCYMYKISDVSMTRSLLQRLFGLSTVICYTSDVTDQTITMKNIKNGREIKDFILKSAEENKLKRRTVNMQDISFDMDGLD